ICKSVPQIEAAFTRTNTSPCPTSGTGTLSIRNPRAASIFRSAFIVAAIPASSSLLPQLINAQSQILAPFGVRRAQPPLSRTNPLHPIPATPQASNLLDQPTRPDVLEGAPSFAPFSEGWALILKRRDLLLCSFFVAALLHLFHHPNFVHRPSSPINARPKSLSSWSIR